MRQQETRRFSIVWRVKKFSLEIDQTATLKSLGDELLKLTNVRDDTLRLIVPTNKSSRLLNPFSEEHSCLKLEAASILELNPPASKALKLMHKLAADPGIVAIMNKHRWRVGIMTEMAPEGYVDVSPKCILGYNKNHGEEISLRLRTDDLKGFRKYDRIKKTLLHELAHMVHSEHDANFHALDKQLNEEAAKLDWTKSRGHTLSGGSLQHYEEDKDNDNHMGLSHKLGGQSSVFNARASSVAAANSRLAHASTNHSEAINMNQESNSGDSLDIDEQSNHRYALPEKQLNDAKVKSLENCNGVFSANVPSDDHRKYEPDPDDYEAGSPMKHEPSTEPDSDDHKMRSLLPLLEAKLREEPDPDDCSSDKNNTGSPISLEPDPDEHAMAIEKKVISGQNSRGSLGYHINEEESGSFTHTNRDDFPERIKLLEPYTDDKDIIPDGVSSTVFDEPDPGDQELQRIQDPVVIVCSRLQKARRVLRSQSNPLEASRVVQTILKIIRNVFEHPDEVKFRKLRQPSNSEGCGELSSCNGHPVCDWIQ